MTAQSKNYSFYQVIADDFTRVNEIIRKQLVSNVPLVEQIAEYIISAGGKRLRPLLVLLAGNAVGKKGDDLCLLAGLIEFIHTSTLLHDDVVDASGLRRGRSTANAIWGNAPSVLVGDFLYTRAFEMMVKLDSMPIMQVISHATRIIAEGEVLQLSRVRDASTTEAIYMDVIRGKTAMLFEAATHSAGVLADASKEQCEALRCFGDALGVAFQLVDDLLDYQGDSSELGKNVGDDLAEGKPTLPLIYAMANGTADQSAIIRKAIQRGEGEEFQLITKIVKETGALGYTASLAKEYAEKAIHYLDQIPDSIYKSAMIDLTKFAVERVY